MKDYQPSSINNDYEEDEWEWIDTLAFFVLFIAGVAVFTYGLLTCLKTRIEGWEDTSPVN